MHHDRIELDNEIAYSIVFNEANARVFGTLKSAVTAAGLVAGTAAVAGLIAASPGLVVLAGLLVAVISVAEIVLRVGDQAAHFRQAARAMRLLQQRSDAMSVADGLRQLRGLRADFDGGLTSLEAYAWNRMCEQRGYPDRMRLTRLQRLVSVLA